MIIETKGMGFGYAPKHTTLHDIDLHLEGNKLISIIGPNGVGKSTLIHCFNKILKPTEGTVLVNERNIEDYTLKELAKFMAYVPCTSSDSFPLTVTDTILLGRNPHSRWGSLDEDLVKVHEVLKIMDIEDLAYRQFNELSAGQHQKVMLARGLVQEPGILLLDEPTSNLDIKHQMGVTKLLRDYSHEKNVLVIMISHDLNIAAKYSDEVIVLHGGTVYADGAPSEVINSTMIRDVYGIESETILSHGRPHIILEDDDDIVALSQSDELVGM